MVAYGINELSNTISVFEVNYSYLFFAAIRKNITLISKEMEC